RRLTIAPAVLAAFAVSLAASAVPWIDGRFSAARILGLLPFFVAGLLWREEWFDRLRSWGPQLLAGFVVVCSIACAVMFHASIRRGEFFYSLSRAELALGVGEAVMHRAVVLLIGSVL